MYATHKNVVKLLVGNKIDMKPRNVTREEAVEYARSKSMIFIECSAKTRAGVVQAFEEVVQKILDTPSLWRKVTPGETDTVNLQQTRTTQDGSSACGGWCVSL